MPGNVGIAEATARLAGFISGQNAKAWVVKDLGLEPLEAKIISFDDHYYTIAGYCNLHKIPYPLHQAKAWGKAAAALSRQKNIPTGTAHDERYGKVRTYHMKVLNKVIK